MKPITITIHADTDGAAANLARLFKGVNGGLNEVTGIISRIAPQLAAIFTLGGFIKMGENALHTADAMNKLAQKTGIATETLSAYAYGAKLADVEQQEMALGLKTLATQIANAAQGSAEAGQAFLRAGVDFKNTDGSMRSLEDVVESLADRFKQMPDGVSKTDAAVALLGRAGQNMIPWLNAGSEGLRKMKEEALAMGLVIKGDTAQRAEELNDNMTRLKLILEGVFLRLADNLLPTLVEWGNEIAKSIRDHGEFGKVIEFVANTIRGLGVVVLFARTVLVSLGRIIGDIAGVSFEAFMDGVKTIIHEQELWLDTVRTLVSGLITLGTAVSSVGEIMSHAMKGEWSKAWTEGKEKVAEMAKALSGMGAHIGDNLKAAFQAVANFSNRSWDAVTGVGSETLRDLKAEWEAFANKALEPFMNKRETYDPRHGGGGEPTVDLKGQQEALDSLNKGYADAFLSRKRLLENEYELDQARIKREIKDEEEKQTALLVLEMTYQKRRADIEREQSAIRSSLELQRAQTLEGLIERDPTKSEVEKKKELIPLLKKEIELTLQQMELYRQVSENQGLSSEERLEAARQLVQLEGQLTQIGEKLNEQNRTGFSFKFKEGLKQLSDEWGDIGANLALTGIKAIEDGVHGISDALMGAIDGTKTWGQVFAQIARSIIASIIQVVVQWIASMTIIAALKKLFGMQDNQQATQSAQAWAPAAVAASIASYGMASLIGTSAYVAALGIGTGITSALSSAAAYASGGLITGGHQLIQANEEGPEFMFSAPATRRALPFLERLHAGLRAGYDLATAIPNALPRPITDDASSLDRLAAAGSSSNINVAPAAVHFALLNDESQVRRYMESNAGRRIIMRNIGSEDRTHPR